MAQQVQNTLRDLLDKLRRPRRKTNICLGTCAMCGGACRRMPGHPGEHRCPLHGWDVRYL